jgi:hypothetical protein
MGVRVESPVVSDASAVLGALAWIAIYASGTLSPIRESIALAMLVLVALGLRLADTARRDGTRSLWYRVAVFGQPLAAVSTVYSLSLSPGVRATLFALPWVGFAAAAVGFGVRLPLNERLVVTPDEDGTVAATHEVRALGVRLFTLVYDVRPDEQGGTSA